MWEHFLMSKHVTRDSYRLPNDLRLLLRKERLPDSPDMIYKSELQSEDEYGPCIMDSDPVPVPSRGTLRLAPQDSPLAIDPNATVAETVDSPSGERPNVELVWTNAMKAALLEACKEYPKSLRWKDRLGLIASRVSVASGEVPVTRSDILARMAQPRAP